MSSSAGADRHDVLVIGSGPGGAAVATRLAEKGARVLCLEQGDWVDPNLLPKAHSDWEVRGRRYWKCGPAPTGWWGCRPTSRAESVLLFGHRTQARARNRT